MSEMTKKIKRHVSMGRKRLSIFWRRFIVIASVLAIAGIILVCTGSAVGFPWVVEKVAEAIADSGADAVGDKL